MEFKHNNRIHVLRGSTNGKIKVVDADKMQKTNQTAVPQLCLMQATDEEVLEPKEVNHEPKLLALLNKFEVVFAELAGLPLRRAQDHRVPLKPGCEPTNLKPYRYPYM